MLKSFNIFRYHVLTYSATMFQLIPLLCFNLFRYHVSTYSAVFRIRIHRIHVVFGLPDPDPLVRGMDPDPALDQILLSSCKNNKKNLESYYFVTLFDFLSMKNNVNVPSKSNEQKKLC